MTERPRLLAADLDGTVLRYDEINKPLGEPIPGIIDVLSTLATVGWKIVIWTVRGNVEEIRAHLNKHGVPFDYINEHPWQPPGASGKIAADVYLDDRALRFDGDTTGLAEKILAFQPWYREPPWAR